MSRLGVSALVNGVIVIAIALASVFGLLPATDPSGLWLGSVMRGHAALPLDVSIVQIDRATLQAEGPWPWPRSKLGQLIDEISASDPLGLGVNIAFSEPSAAINDQALAEALKKPKVVVLGYVRGRRVEFLREMRDLPHVASGFVDLVTDGKGTVIGVQKTSSPAGGSCSDTSFSFCLAGAAGHRRSSTMPGAIFRTDYAGRSGTFNTVSALSLLRHQEKIPKGQIVILGADLDFGVVETPFGEMSLSEVHANVVQSLLDDRQLSATRTTNMIVLAGLAAFFWFFTGKRRWQPLLVGSILYIILVYVAFRQFAIIIPLWYVAPFLMANLALLVCACQTEFQSNA